MRKGRGGNALERGETEKSRLLGAGHPPAPPRQGLRVPGPRGPPDQLGRGARADPRARDPSCLGEVRICIAPNGHLQATGVDAASRKQYIYHPLWRARRDQQKFDERLDFARSLPKVRRRISRDIDGGQLSRERVLACAVRMLDSGCFRIGSEQYAEQNGSFGLATMRKEHVSLNGTQITFDYPAKSGRRLVQSIADPDVRAIVAALKRRRGGGAELLAYREGRNWRDIGSDEINEYIKSISGRAFSAKDFRTWNATMLAVEDAADITCPSTRRVVENAVLDLITEERSPALEKVSVD